MKKGKWILGTVLTLFAALLLLAGAFAVESFAMLDLDKIRNQPLSTVLYDRDGKEAALLSGAQKRSWMPIEDLSQDLKNAFLAAEDARFYRHPGVDFVRIGGALISNIKSGGYAQGASTITQQLVKLTHLTSEKTILRKAREALMALKLETELSKDEIFEAYLNTVYFGAGAYGAQAAAQTYFGVDAGQLTLAQAALLAGVVKSPTNYAPRQHPDEAVKRRNRVLAAMAEQGFIPPEIETAAQAEALALKPVEGQDQALSWFTEAAAAEAASVLQIDYEDLLSGGYKLYTTLDRAAQKSAEALCGDAAYFPPDASDGTPVQTALVCLDGAGELRAVMGGRRVETQRGLNRAIDIRRQPGSAFKPISVYAAAVDRFGYLPVRLIDDTRRTFAGGYNPGNFGDTYAGRVTLREALSRSLNVATVDLAEKTGIPAARQYAQAAGIELSSADNNLSLALGSLTEGVSPLALCAAYGPLYTGGNWTQPHAVRRITDAAGETVYRFTGEKRRVFSETSAALLTDMLRTAATTGTARKLGALPFQAAGKTGTVGQPDGGNRDVWTVAYTPKLCVAVWMGFDQPDSRHVLSDAVTGSSHPCALATAFLREVAAPPFTSFETPANLTRVPIDLRALEIRSEPMRASAYTPPAQTLEELFPRGTEPRRVSDVWERPTKIFDLRADVVEGGMRLSFTAVDDFALYRVFKNGALLCELSGQRGETLAYVDFESTGEDAYTVLPVHRELYEQGIELLGEETGVRRPSAEATEGEITEESPLFS